MKNILIPCMTALTALVSADLTVMSRNTVFEQFANSTIPAKLNNFGFIQENTSRLGKLIVPTEKTRGCMPLSMEDDFDQAQVNSEHPVSLFLMVERGGCSFEVKIKNAMAIGCSVLIISDWEDGEPQESGKPSHKGKGFGFLGHEGERPPQLPPAEEGVLTAHIPTFEISYFYGDALRQAYNTGESIYLNANM